MKTDSAPDGLRVLLVGPSVRALAGSARRAGWQPICFDLFGDVDLRAMADVEVIPFADYPQGLVDRLQRYPSEMPVIYTGGLENHQSVLQALQTQRPVWGYVHPSPHDGNSIRNPRYLDRIAQASGLHRPRHTWQHLPSEGAWLQKPLAGAGGRGITRWQPGTELPAGYFLEEYHEGISLSAVYAQVHQTVRCLGITQQLIGCEFLHAPTPFTYCGNIAMYPDLSEVQQQHIDSVGQHLIQSDLHLQGLFGVDFLLHQGNLYLLEVNPRYTASMELIEYAAGASLLSYQAQSYGYPAQVQSHLVTPGQLGKAIYFAPQTITFPAHGPWSIANHDCWSFPRFADIPAPGTRIEGGQPVLTLMVQGHDAKASMIELMDKAQQLDALLVNG